MNLGNTRNLGVEMLVSKDRVVAETRCIMSVQSLIAGQTPKTVIDAHGHTRSSQSQASSVLTRHVAGVQGFWRRSPLGSIR